MKLRVLSLFAGIGGFDLGLERTGGFHTVAVAELDPYASRILALRFPEAVNVGDVTKADYPHADIICAGFPCQDISYAGAGAGLAGARSGLFWEVVRAARVVRPSYIILENVAALLGRGLDTVLWALAEIGYDTEWHCIPASAVGAPHRRDRIWIIAHPRGEQHKGSRAPLSGEIAAELSRAVADACTPDRLGAEADALGPDADSLGPYRAQEHLFGSPEFRDEQVGLVGSMGEDVADAAGERCREAGQLRSDEQAQWASRSGETLANAKSGGWGEGYQDAGGRGPGEGTQEERAVPAAINDALPFVVATGLGETASSLAVSPDNFNLLHGG